MSVPPSALQSWSSPHQFEPLLPAVGVEELRAAGRAVAERAYRLQGQAHPQTLRELRELVRAMNSYYSNLIEGQSTHPVHIDQALHAHFADRPDIARRQRLALAHIRAESELEAQIAQGEDPLPWRFAARAHACLYAELPQDDRRDNGRTIEPGVLRTQHVKVGRHHAPSPESLPRFLDRFDQVYVRRWAPDELPYVAAAAHHRMVWVHPFEDGNGRASRLQMHGVLWRLSAGLWSASRGLARDRGNYYRLLSDADMARQGDLDGRGNLSERALLAWCRYFVALCDDQVSFMARMLNLEEMKARIAALVAVRSHAPRPGQSRLYRPEAMLPLYHLFAAGPLARSEFAQMTGLGERTARSLLATLLEDRLVRSDTPKGPVRFAFPLDALNILLPDLYPEASTRVID